MIALARTPARGGYVAEVNAVPGLVVIDLDGAVSVISLTVDGGRIVAVDIIRNPDKLRGIASP